MEKKPVCFFLPVLVWFLSISRTCSAQIVSNQTTDRDALVAFKTAIISDPYEILVKNWSSDASICNWIGVSCSRQRVTALNFSGFSFQGTVAPSLGNLTFLSSLDLRSNNFTGFIPQELSNLHRLQVINVGFNSFTGEIPSWFGTLPELEFILLNNNNFSGSIPPSLGDCSKLRILNLAYNFLGGSIPQEIANLSSLETLDLKYNYQITGPIPYSIFNLSSIEKIDLTGNSLSGGLPKDMCNSIPRLSGLHLSLNLLSGEIPFNIYKCSQLQDLSLSFNHFNGSIPSSIGRLANIKTLFLGVNSFQGGVPLELRNLSRLESLSIRGASLTGKIPSFIFNMSSLKQVDLGNNSLSGSLPVALYHNLPNLEQLFLQTNQLTGQILDEIWDYLEYLYLDNNNFTGELPAELVTMLELSANHFSGQLPSTFGLSLPNLLELYLSDNELSGAIPSYITNASSLRILDMGRESPNREMSFLSSFTNCRYLQSVEVSLNQLNGVLPASIGNFSTCLQEHWESQSNFYVYILSTISSKEEFPSDLCQLSNLGDFYVSNNTLHGSIPSCFGELKSLRGLYLDSNKLDSNVPSNLWNLKDLLGLNLSSNILSGFLPSEIGNLKVVRDLDLSWNQFSGNLPSAIGGALSLVSLSLSHNKFRGLKGQIPTGGKFVNFTAQSFLKNDVCVARLDYKFHHVEKVLTKQDEKGAKRYPKVRFPYFIHGEEVLIWNFNEPQMPSSQPTYLEVEVLSEKVAKSFDTEIEVLSTIRHRNLIKIIGCCSNPDFKALVLEYMPNGSLEKWLYSHNCFLDLVQRLNIAIDVASALEYLHLGYTFPIVHCDLKPSNVLLDKDMTAHVGDFGIAKIFSEGEYGTLQQWILAPELDLTGVATSGDVLVSE
ncbi:UNVERIFIED_CONTAM: putative LRR receptor-like serine/threonine-protein kinase [Sesamum angustifolium]|uniref:non-specific serine/threonine protein kinase n=1 Tax=Sesamum angustifolium TaxID=2727405 RepID=A0AAW2LY33_9LAMI